VRACAGVLVAMLLLVASESAWAALRSDAMPWWAWPIVLFVVCLALGVVAVPAGVGGGVLFVPFVSGFFPFHLDFVRAAGLFVALASALAAGPALLRGGLANLRLALPMATLASASAIGGALIGLALPTSWVEIALGTTILAIVVLMTLARRSEFPPAGAGDRVGRALGLEGVFHDRVTGRRVAWRAQRTPTAMVLFVGIGVLAGLFGLGAGWANVPVLNLLMGVPLKVSVGTSSFILSLVDSAAVWVYLNRGAVLPAVVVPAVLGMMLGAMLGARLLNVLRGSTIRALVITILVFAGVRALLKGTGVWT
jgi:uncharacterized membrane protein YfcA